MISPKLRLLLVALFMVSAVICLLLKIWYAAITLSTTAIILLLGHFRHGLVHMVLQALRNGKISKAQNLIYGIKCPQWLKSTIQNLLLLCIICNCYLQSRCRKCCYQCRMSD